MIFKPVLNLFERWIDPFARRQDYQPPSSTSGFLRHYVGQAKGAFAAMLALGGLVALLEAAMFYFVGRLVDVLDTTEPSAGWDGLIAAHGPTLAFMLCVVLVGRFVVVTLAALVEEQTVVPGFFNLVRWQAHAHVSRQDLSFFQNDFAGRIVNKVWTAGQATGDFMVSLLQVAWFIFIYTLTTIALVAQLDWRLSALVLVWVTAFALLARYFVPRIRRHARASAEASAMLTGRLTDSYSNIQTVKLYARDADNDRYIREGFDQFIGAILPFTRHLTGVRASLAALSGVMIAAIAIFSINLWLAGAISVGSVAFTLSLVLRLNMLFGRMMTQLNSLMRNLGTVQNSADMVARPVGLSDRAGAAELKVERAAIRFEGASFAYDPAIPVIRDLSLSIKPGEKIGLVGRSGAGKSTFVNLLLRFYDLEAGRIEIDGQDIAGVTQESLRQHIGMVTQDTSLLHRSIRENIIFGRPEADDRAIREAARRAEALDFIDELSDQRGRKGLDAHVGDRGVKLSGGQRQRIAIARVMLKDAPILVLDEATSALDSEVEAAIQENLEELMTGKTVIAIAHRLSTIARMDRLIVMDQGRILEMGSHAELLANGGLYAELWARQSGGFLGVGEAAE
ncbi:ABC-type multidrug transport system, ATPase and permease component [Hoeflea phototrophica DFL-43]|uniref:ABC-type multidrug transport system, ATPase and permease component n=1 Tax=Hoeflea phototrophica (strain DSM 17068 / NCIMB 14078 / DFL-43) TaxID=411684 RepID=A9DHA5_HOEPD|nr:ABC transporter ATP-binding protein [Hoeflea phototrophica]EDQ31508.1 ABC-type multidrug transport system, ATPase and permease component [Hoeflea phototrophica DFL-43]